MSFIRRYWRGELVRLHTWTREMAFTHPFRLSGFTMALPPGRYAVEFAEMEVAVRDRTVKQIVRCMFPVPAMLLPPGLQTVFKNVNHAELEQRHSEDRKAPGPEN